MDADTPENFVYLETSNLRPAPFLTTLFPAGRDWPLLRESLALYGYKYEYPVVVRQRLDGEGFEVIDGVGRVTIAREAGMEYVPTFVRVLEDEQARRFVVEANLYSAHTQARIKLVPAIILALEHERSGGDYRVQRILEATGVAIATYKRARAGLNFAVERLRREHPELESRTEAEVAAVCLTRQLWPQFEQFYAGELEPFSFYKHVYSESSLGKARRKKAVSEVAGHPGVTVGEGVGQAGTQETEGHTSGAVMTAAEAINTLLKCAQGRTFARHISEDPLLHDAITSWDKDLEVFIPYFTDLTNYLRKRRTARKAVLRKLPPKNPDQFQIIEVEAAA